MSRYLYIILFIFLTPGLNAQEKNSVKAPGKVVQKQDTIQGTSRKFQDSISVKSKKQVIQIPDSVRYSPKVTPSKAFINPIVIISNKQGLIKNRKASTGLSDTVQTYIQVYKSPALKKRPPEVVYDLKAPPANVPVNFFVLVPLEKDLIIPPWIIAQRKAAEEAKKNQGTSQDTVRGPRIIKMWNLSADFSTEVPVVFDTLFTLFNRYRVPDLYSPVNANLGNYGLPYYSLNFFDRISDPDKYLYSYLYHFMHTPENALFMNLQVPFTEAKWIFSGEKQTAEQVFRITHSQNINRHLNFGLIYDIIFNLGQYTNQRAEDKTFTFYTSYTGSRYKLYFSAGINGLFGQENGGITDKKELDITIANTRDIPVNLGTLNDAKSLIKNRNLLVVQKYTFLGAQPDNDTIPLLKPVPEPLTGTFSHIFEFDYSRRTYSDASPGSGFYDSIYINKSTTFDSLSAKLVKNTFRFDFSTDITKPVRFEAGFGLRNENFWFGQIIPGQDSIVSDTANWFRGDNVLIGKVANYIGKEYSWLVNGELYIDRYRKGDYVLNGVMSKYFDLKKGQLDWLITAGINKRTPSFWYTQWGSNNFRWNFNAVSESRMELGTQILYPARNVDLRFNYARINNYIDFDTLALPSQDTSRLNVMSLALKKDFRLWKFHFVPDVILQKSSNTSILDLPKATVRAAAYFDHMFRFEKTNGRLYTQLGVDIIYNTLYHPYNYMPATGRYYRQTQTETGDYPFVNVFLIFKIKRTRFLFMFDHVNYGLMSPEKLYNYELVPLYPQNIRRFTFGLAWTFYN